MDYKRREADALNSVLCLQISWECYRWWYFFCVKDYLFESRVTERVSRSQIVHLLFSLQKLPCLAGLGWIQDAGTASGYTRLARIQEQLRSFYTLLSTLVSWIRSGPARIQTSTCGCLVLYAIAPAYRKKKRKIMLMLCLLNV